MKFILISLLFTSLSLSGYGQLPEPSLKPVKTRSLIKLLGSTNSIMTIMANNFIFKVFLIANPSGSAMQAGGHESSQKLLINVAEYDENPVWKLFSIGPFYNLKISTGPDLKDKYMMRIEHGGYEERKQTKLAIYFDKVLIE